MMKICIVKESLCLGGTERSAANISVALAQKHNVDMLLYNGEDIKYQYGGMLYDMKTPSKESKIGKVLDHIRRIVFFSLYLMRNKPDVVYLFVSFRHPLYKMRMRKQIKMISARDFSALASHIDSFKSSLDVSDGLIFNSNYMREFYLSRYPEDKNKVFSVWNIIDTCEIIKQAKEPIHDEEFIRFREKYEYLVVSVGRFCIEKAFEHLISAVSQCCCKGKSIGLVLVGDGECKNKYLSLIHEYGISDNVYFTGFQQNPYQYMHKCDVFVLSSISEGFPNVLAEALALSMPVVSVNCYSGPAEILLNEPDYNIVKDSYIYADYGILTPHYNVVGISRAINEMAKAILQLLDDNNARERYAQLAYRRSKLFSKEEATIQLEHIFMSLIREKRNK